MKSLVVPVIGSAGDRPVIDTAFRLAEAFGAHITFLHVREDVVRLVAAMVAGQSEGPIGLEEMRGDLEQDATDHAQKARQEVEALCAARHLTLTAEPEDSGPVEWASVTGVAAEVLVAWARTADLIAIGRAVPGDTLSDVLLECGRPVLFVPEAIAAAGPLLDHIVIAWNDTAEAARAVTAASPLLALARSVSIVTVLDGADDPASASAARLASTIGRHAQSVSLTMLGADGQSAGDAVLGAAQAASATLLVMGGFSHSRLRQMVFGGFTRDMLAAATLPVLIAH